MAVNSIAIIPSYSTKYSSRNIFYPFQQNNDLLWLTGYNEPNGILSIEKFSENSFKTRFFHSEADEHELLWSGPNATNSTIKDYFGLDLCEKLCSFSEYLSSSIHSNNDLLYTDAKGGDILSDGQRKLLLENAKGKEFRHVMDSARVIKSEAERLLMVKASEIGSSAFKSTMKFSMSTRKEADLAAHMEWKCRIAGATGLSYLPVVAGGDRANIIHYVRNDRLIADDEMVLMDSGAKYHGYCSDITRTWPVSGRFSQPHLEVYSAVLSVQEKLIRVLCERGQLPEPISMAHLHHFSELLMIEELGKLGFADPKEMVKELYPHSIGHWIGLDLHDCSSFPMDAALQEGMTLTIEPGLYIPSNPKYPLKYHGIGVRIEDDILLTKSGCQVMSKQTPKHPQEIEEFLHSK